MKMPLRTSGFMGKLFEFCNFLFFENHENRIKINSLSFFFENHNCGEWVKTETACFTKIRTCIQLWFAWAQFQ
jgi:hypothetical protein